MQEVRPEFLPPLRDYFEREFGNIVEMSEDPHHVGLAYTETEDPPYTEMQVEADLIEYKFRFFYGGKLVKEDTAPDAKEFLCWLMCMSFDSLVGECEDAFLNGGMRNEN